MPKIRDRLLMNLERSRNSELRFDERADRFESRTAVEFRGAPLLSRRDQVVDRRAESRVVDHRVDQAIEIGRDDSRIPLDPPDGQQRAQDVQVFLEGGTSSARRYSRWLPLAMCAGNGTRRRAAKSCARRSGAGWRRRPCARGRRSASRAIPQARLPDSQANSTRARPLPARWRPGGGSPCRASPRPASPAAEASLRPFHPGLVLVERAVPFRIPCGELQRGHSFPVLGWWSRSNGSCYLQ